MAFDPVSAALDLGGKIIDRVWQDPAKKAEASLELLKLQQSGELAQITGQLEVNKTEAASSSTFVAGWRPFIGWVCGFGLGVDVVARPLLNWGSALAGHAVNLPALDMSTLFPLLLGMLGLGGMRTYEKVSGINAGH